MADIKDSIIDPVIFLPGITASSLSDRYSVPDKMVWNAATYAFPVSYKSRYDQIVMHPANNFNYETDEPASIYPRSVFSIAYKEFFDVLRKELSRKNKKILEKSCNKKSCNISGEVPVYPFPYDWRQPLENVELQLDKFVDEVIKRTKLMPDYNRVGWSGDITLIGHSMGGYIAASYAMNAQKNAELKNIEKISRLITLAAPFKGSVDVPFNMTRKSLRYKTLRLLPSSYYLIPGEVYVVDNNKASLEKKGLFRTKNWQQSVINDLNCHIQGIQVSDIPLEDIGTGEDLLEKMLVQASTYRDNLIGTINGSNKFTRDNFLVIVGIGQDTLAEVYIYDKNGKKFKFTGAEVKEGKEGNDHVYALGDGTVTQKSAYWKKLRSKSLVVGFSLDDYRDEIKDWLFLAASGFPNRINTNRYNIHANLPNLNDVQSRIVHFLTSKEVIVDKSKYGYTMGKIIKDKDKT